MIGGGRITIFGVSVSVPNSLLGRWVGDLREVIPPRPHGQNTRSKRWSLSGEGRIDGQIVERDYLGRDMDRTGMVITMDRGEGSRDYEYVGHGKADYEMVSKCSKVTSGETKKLFHTSSEPEKAAVDGLSRPSGGTDRDRDRRVQGGRQRTHHR